MASPYDTAHRDGFRPVRSEDELNLIITVQFWVEGKPADPSLFAPFEFNRSSKELPAADERAMVLASAVCTFLNTGGSCRDLFAKVDGLVERAPDISTDLSLVSVLPYMVGNTIIWKRGDGMYLRVEEGDEGFTEILSEEQLKANYRDLLDDYGPDAV